jgi:four helix bundle protein
MEIKTFKDLIVWQKSYKLVLEIYKITKLFPSDERFGIVSQIRRAAISIPSNIAEGYGRKYLKQYIQFLYVAYASGAELETQIMLSKDLNFLSESIFDIIIGEYYEVERMLMGLIRALENKT